MGGDRWISALIPADSAGFGLPESLVCQDGGHRGRGSRMTCWQCRVVQQEDPPGTEQDFSTRERDAWLRSGWEQEGESSHHRIKAVGSSEGLQIGHRLGLVQRR
ncbi:hypothetical protein AAFF_G00277030 [Aldrovandia affinis]|uniref:Uncharacterized protein n=1 Tax=Aldrovandia affinis TaxID=143900 RepID=A0AAD7RAK8_9TELE|nr:hypothetical protein AAFF_G00277030 [Aldrovandia affinis]